MHETLSVDSNVNIQQVELVNIVLQSYFVLFRRICVPKMQCNDSKPTYNN